MGRRIYHAIGERFGRWTIAGSAVHRGETLLYPCRCDCGTEKLVIGGTLRSGMSRSCGCLKDETTARVHTKHGDASVAHPTALYSVWRAMIARCHGKVGPAFHFYGARGISVCQEWRDSYPSFRDWALSHGYAKGLSIDRQDNDGNYEPGNCRWTDRITQANNQRGNRYREAFGESKTIAEWSRDPRCVPCLNTLHGRLFDGMDLETALTKPLRK